MGLDPNHTHFILVDDGSVGEFGKEQVLRGKLEKKLCSEKQNGVKKRSATDTGEKIQVSYLNACQKNDNQS